MDNSSSQQVKEETDGWGRKLSAFFTLILMLLIALFAIMAISEIAARESVMSMLTGRVASLKSDFVAQNRTEINIPVISSPDDKLQKKEPNYQRESLLEKIEFYEELKRNLTFLIAHGALHPSLSLRTIQLSEIFNLKPVHLLKDINQKEYEQSTNFIQRLSHEYLTLSSDQLLAIAIMACAAIGAMIAALRGNGLMTLRALALGVATGFVVYLAIKGGKHVFLLQMQTEIVAFNPYGSAFAGLLAGMFTEKAYQLLTTIVDEFADRLRTVAAGKKNSD